MLGGIATMRRNQRTKILAAASAALCAVCFSIGSVAAEQPKPQGLWVGGEKYFSEFQGKALQNSGTPKAHLVFGSTVYDRPGSIAFDAHQNLWAVFYEINDNLPSAAIEISRRDMALLKAGKRVKPQVVIAPQNNSTVPFVFAVSIAFDAGGDLWVVDGNRRIVELLPSQIKNSGAPTPGIVITPTDATVSHITFDGSDNLWVAAFPNGFNPSYPQQMWRFTPSDRAASGPATPSLVLNIPGQIFVLDVAFDSSGNLWIAGSNSQGDVIEMISASDLSGAGESFPPAGTTITSSTFTPSGSGDCVGGIDFDRSGDLWVSISESTFGCDNAVVEFAASQLSAGGDLMPVVVIGQNITKTNLFLSGPIRFGPTVP
jgi:hypothetical protein